MPIGRACQQPAFTVSDAGTHRGQRSTPASGHLTPRIVYRSSSQAIFRDRRSGCSNPAAGGSGAAKDLVKTQPPRGSPGEPGRNLAAGKQEPDRGAGFGHLGQVEADRPNHPRPSPSRSWSRRGYGPGFAARPAIRWYVPSPAVKPGQITEKPAGAPAYPARSIPAPKRSGPGRKIRTRTPGAGKEAGR